MEATLYPEIEPFDCWHLVQGPHRIHVEQCGNPGGVPVLFLHGGPGSGCRPCHRQFFDPAHYHIILFDQRGAGRSRPHGLLEDNDTGHLLGDMEAIRERLGLERWLLFGGSWGATLALLYAQKWPERVSGLILRGVFLARRRDIDWFFHDGANRFFPEQWQQLCGELGRVLGDELIEELHRRLHTGDRQLALAAARAWSDWSGKVVSWSLDPAPQADDEDGKEEDPEYLIRQTTIEMHYARNRYFIEENQILRHAGRLPRVPTVIIHGRRDLTCTPEAAWLLHRAIPGSGLELLSQAGHLASEPQTMAALVATTDRFRELLS